MRIIHGHRQARQTDRETPKQRNNNITIVLNLLYKIVSVRMYIRAIFPYTFNYQISLRAALTNIAYVNPQPFYFQHPIKAPNRYCLKILCKESL